jgi:predicted adenine nucleotide alpha hydrolase (AANH) superfamily ATPase
VKTNYQLLTDRIIDELDGKRASLLLHACCAPCSSYVLEYLDRYFDITLLYYNPNIASEKEYILRADELKRLVNEMPFKNDVTVVLADYCHEEFEKIALGREDMREGGVRCFDCYRLRLDYAAKFAHDSGYDYFTTTLSISPHKNAEVLNNIGKEMADKYHVKYLFSDFKKKGGYLRSCELSEKYGLYRQDFCGCEYSEREAKLRRAEKGK